MATPFANPKRQFRTRRDTSPAPIHNIYTFYESESSKSKSKDVVEIDIETLTLEQYLNLNNTRGRISNPNNATFEIKGQLLRELRKTTFSGSSTENAIEHIRRVLEGQTRRIIDSNGLIHGLTASEELKSIQELADHSHKWHNEESKNTPTSFGIFPSDNNVLPNLENHDTMFFSPLGSARLNDNSSEMSCNPNSNSSISMDDFVEMDNIWNNLDFRDLTNEDSTCPAFYHLACTALLSFDCLLACLLCFELIIVTIKPVPVSQAENLPLSLELEEHSKEEETIEVMTKTMEQYMSKTRGNYGSGVARPKINDKTHFELKGQFLKKLRENTFSGLEHEDANEHIEKFLKIVDLFHIPEVTQDQIMLRAFPMSLTGAASHLLRNEPSGSITNWETLKTKFLYKYCPPTRTTKKMEEINNFQQEPDESLFRAWERFKELLMKCPQHYLTDMQEVILFYNRVDVPTRLVIDSKGAIPTKTIADAKVAIQEMAEYSQKCLGREIKKVNEKVCAAHVGCELCKGPHYTKDCPLKEEGKTLEEAYYIQFGAPYYPGGQYRAAEPGFYQCNNRNSSYPDRRQTLEEPLTKFTAESAKRHEENSNIIKEI
ncbi:gypsy/ty3 retroelement polyprotein [Tanacetum coccineum]|uniref:Gypsy/ty3 retroelement polyprotein n=1 Tax=Tanacetum coccineum TaxID=301880 RepID=A0ABQ5EEH3_9ASTR